MSQLQQTFTVEVHDRKGDKRNVDVKIIDDPNAFLGRPAEEKLDPVDGYSVSCKTGIDYGLGVRRVTVASQTDDSEVGNKRMIAQFNSWHAACGVTIARSSEDLQAIEAVTKQLIQRLDRN